MTTRDTATRRHRTRKCLRRPTRGRPAWSSSTPAPVQPPLPRHAAPPTPSAARGFGIPPPPPHQTPPTRSPRPRPRLAPPRTALAHLASSRLQRPRPPSPSGTNPTQYPTQRSPRFPSFSSAQQLIAHLTSPPHPLFRAPHFTPHQPLPLKNYPPHPHRPPPPHPYPPTSAID